MKVKIINIATANPFMKLSQSQSWSLLSQEKKLSRREAALYKRFLSDPGIHTRSFAVEETADFFIQDQDRLIRRFQKEATRLSVASLKQCFQDSQTPSGKIDSVIAATCTGYLCPGLSSYIVEGSGLRPDVHAEDIAGMGCGAALPAVRSAFYRLTSGPESFAAVVATEVCSSALHWEDDPELILSNSIFGDGSVACLMTNQDGARGLRIVDFESRLLPGYREKLRFTVKNSMLRNVIKPEVPELAASLIKEIVSDLLERNRLEQKDVAFWAIHPGGRKVLDAIQATMNLDGASLRHSRRVLFDYGNMSSPSVLYVLREILQSGSLKSGDYVLASSFGAGFSGYAVLLQSE